MTERDAVVLGRDLFAGQITVQVAGQRKRLAVDKPTAEQLGYDVILISKPQVDRLVGALTSVP
ncbi:hypothetical protein HLB23_12650 [Nocardia uniformis]|uniref:Uncharacterized protein n=1 Tax=Nocardia uniformis TaxID=53432 RepID=A0A849BWS3_9NOCA|nr:hypothetical protein [Nocardia uniformis]NNH70704.1 hypothetical protein [Nocardia uniformis]